MRSGGVSGDAMGELDRRPINQNCGTLPFPNGAGNMAAGGGTIKAETAGARGHWRKMGVQAGPAGRLQLGGGML
jgi:hypothetical protein